MSAIIAHKNDPALAEQARRAETLYDDRLKAIVEPEQNGKVIAIHPESGEFEVAVSTGDAMRALLKRHPEGGFFFRHIGPPTPAEFSRAARLEALGIRRG